MQLKNKIVLITGATSGIGEACALQFAQAGAKLILCARRLEKLKTLSEKIKNAFQTAIYYFKCDVQNYEEIKKQFPLIPDEFKDIAILLNNAGLAAGLDEIQHAAVQDWEQMIDTNVKGLLYMTREVLPRMIAKNAGHIINIGSISSHSLYPKGVVYCATKHAVKALSQGLRMDLFGTKIRVSEVDPGAVETNFSAVRFKGDVERAAKVYEGFDPLRAEDIADAVLYCATRPAHINVSEMIVMPTDQVSVTMVARQRE
ncbi:MAG: NAD(P)-dependent oxidoreductase [Gammaproteobacteria bacterium RIFCSPHIGHO2_02_FULL_39_13]|nr:MAG: NAD(P)-dependent oxidoreductase [Gammaproteobacteria bacterium RIFCSPHIGHO2_02_FULL_39_13]OGT48677.1 MAG: NAD(P)-dependent oxidoreductase [Gammaproteobacteria bacterium RIFCSPHIGHO2_12_FULL_39_24]